MLQINNFGGWLTALLNFLGYFIYGFGSISRGNAREVIKSVGVILVVLSFILGFVFFGLGGGIGFIILAFVIVAPITGLLINIIEKRLYGDYLKQEKKLAENYQMPVGQLRKYEDGSDSDILKEVMPGIIESEERNKKAASGNAGTNQTGAGQVQSQSSIDSR